MTSASTRSAKAPGGLPGVGHLVAFGRDPLGFLGTLADHGDLVEIGWGPRPVLVLCSPDLADQVLRDPETFDKGGPYFERFRQIFGLGLFTSEREQHRRQRALIQPLFHRDRIAEYSKVMASTAAEVTGRWRAGQVVDVVREMTEITMQVTLKCMFTVSLAEDERAKVGTAAANLLNDAFWRFVMPNSWDRLPTPLNRRFRRSLHDLDSVVYRIIDEYRHRGADSPDLLSAMVGSRGEDDDALTDRELRDNVVTFIFGGTETTAALLSWCLHFLGHHPTVERTLHDEVDRVLDGRTPAFADVPRLEHTGRIVSEALRLYAPGWIFTRVTLTDTELAGRPVPAGTVLIYCPYLLHRRGDLFPTRTASTPTAGGRAAHRPPRTATPRSASAPANASATSSAASRRHSRWRSSPHAGVSARSRAGS